MSFSLRCLPTFLLVFFGLTAALFAQSTAQPNKPARGAISGRITIKDKGVGGVVVGVRKVNRSSPINTEPFAKTTTDQDGYYRINNLAAASYEVIPSAPAFVIGGTNFRRAKAVILGEDETIDGINFSLVRGGVITGRVTDAEGRPAIQQGVQLYRIETPAPNQQPAQPPLSPANGGVTDDRGIYRMFGLVPGRYKIAAGKGEDPFAPPTPPGRFVYTQVFYPDATDNTKATIIEVTEGSETKDIDIVLGRALQTFSASGRVVDEKNVAVPSLRFGFQRSVGEQREFVNTAAVSNSQGDFIAEGLIPGKYGIYMFPSQGDEVRIQNVSFEIVDQDVEGLTIRLSKGGSLSGVVVLETEDKTALEKLAKLQLRAFVSTPTGFGGSASSSISPDGSFRLGGLQAGTVNIMLGSFTGPMPMAGFQIARIERDGVAVPRNIELKDSEQITNLRVVLAHGNATLRGVIKIENGTLPDGAQIYVRLTKPGDTSSYARPVLADARGHFLIEAIASGVYELSAQMFGPGTGPPKITKREVNVQEGVANEIVVTIDMSAPAPKP